MMPVYSHVFVYGTLRNGQDRDINRLQPRPIFKGNGRINGILYDLGDYPGARLGGKQWIQGEVYQITPEMERQLDAIEEVWPQQSGEYVRRVVVVQCAGAALSCLVYEVATAHTKDKVIIASGDWVERQFTRQKAFETKK
jgi:gamma-glutamylcyclotransferase (GGCT)/AIG2-like uncharacterized protein YtfP